MDEWIEELIAEAFERMRDHELSACRPGDLAAGEHRRLDDADVPDREIDDELVDDGVEM